MSRPSRSHVAPMMWFAVSLGVVGCGGGMPEMPPPPPPNVSVAYALDREVVDTADFTGRTAAVESVQIRARVWGHLERINFPEGADVKKGDVLFVVDQRPYKAALARAEADVAQAEARLRRLESESTRLRELVASRSVSREDYEKSLGDLAETRAAVRAATAGRETAQLNFDYTEVRAPISGQTSRAQVTVGNLVQSGEMGGTVLTTIVSIDPVYAYFDVDDNTLTRVRALGQMSLVSRARDRQPGPPVYLGLVHEAGKFPHRGEIDFMDNQVEPGTGTYKVRGIFENKERDLIPGQFARVRVPLGQSHRAVLITERAIDTDQGQKIVFVVGTGEMVEKRLVVLGGLHDGLREVISGVQAGERVVIDGIQRVRGGIPVVPRLIDMPTPAPAARGGAEESGMPHGRNKK